MNLYRQGDTSSFSRQNVKAVDAVRNLGQHIPFELRNTVHQVASEEGHIVEEQSIVVFAENYFAICVTSFVDEEVAKRQNLPQELRYAVVFVGSKIFVFNEAGKLISYASPKQERAVLDINHLYRICDENADRLNLVVGDLNYAAQKFDIEFDPAGDLVKRVTNEFKLKGLVVQTRPAPKDPKEEICRVLICDTTDSVSVVAAKTDKNGKIISAKLEFDRSGNFKNIQTFGFTAGEEMGVIKHDLFPAPVVQKALQVFGEQIRKGLTARDDRRLLGYMDTLEADRWLNGKAAAATAR